jgi:hypothetical protein
MKTPDPHFAFTLPSAMIGATVLIFLLRIRLWRICCRSCELTTLVLSAPPMPMAMLTPMVQPPVAPLQMAAPINQAKESNASVPITIGFT